jgi:heat shock protein HslJ
MSQLAPGAPTFNTPALCATPRYAPLALSLLAVLMLAACATPQVYVAPPQGDPGANGSATSTTMDKPPLSPRTGDDEPASAESTGSESAEPPQGPQGPLVPLLDSDWIATELAGTPVPDTLHMTLSFYIDRTIAGLSGCNRFSGAADMDYQTLRITALVSTGINCPAKSGTLERDFLRALSDTTAYKIDGPALEILDGSGKTLAILRTAG